MLEDIDGLLEEDTFVNTFQNVHHKKIIHGIQQLYIIGKFTLLLIPLQSLKIYFFLGLFDALPIPQLFCVLKQHLPSVLYRKLSKYVLTSTESLKDHLSWSFFKHHLDKLDLEQCSQKICAILKQTDLKESMVKTFHICNNLKGKTSIEPNHKNTTQMIYKFLTYIYQRNIIASLLKYILLKPLLHKLETSLLIDEKRGIFYLIHQRLSEIIFESVLVAFNGSNYDNYLICNSLSLILTKLRQRMQIFKKGASISTIKIIIKHNFKNFTNITEAPLTPLKLLRTTKQWNMNLYIKDVRNLIAANMSLDKVGQVFNLKVSKLCFPYEQATSIKKLKLCTSLHPTNEKFWHDSFSGKSVPIETRLHAQTIFNIKKFENLYEYSTYYLIQDCVLLHSFLLTFFRTNLNDSVNIFLRKIYSQSNLAFQQFFIIEPSRQIDKVLAPKKINNTFYNYIIKQGVTGGLCTSFVHGKIDQNTIINEHLNYITNPNLNPVSWPNFANFSSWDKIFHSNPIGINTIDIRSLYPSATLKKMPVNSPIFYSQFIKEDFDLVKNTNFNTIDIHNYCSNVRTQGNFQTDYFRLLSKPPRFHNEFHAINFYLNTLPKDIVIIRFQTSFTALGQLVFVKYPIDGFLCFKKNPSDKIMYIKLIQYQSVFYHGHKDTCGIPNSEEQIKLTSKSKIIKNDIQSLYTHFKSHFNLAHLSIEYIEIFDCDFICHKIPKIKPFMFPYKKNYTYQSFLDNILQKKLTGFLIIKDLEIKTENKNPIIGFIIQKVEYQQKHLSEYTQRLLQHFTPSPRVVALHKNQSFMVITTEYFVWLHKHFGFEHTPDIYHALLFQLDTYLKPTIEAKLSIRKELKERIKHEHNTDIKRTFEVKAELIKLMLNSCYGFTLCNLTSTKFTLFENRTSCPKHKKKLNRLKSCIQLDNNVYLVELEKVIKEPFETMLGHVGCNILGESKKILLKRLYFLLKYLNPTKAQLLYMDTDSAHFLVKHKLFADNVDANLRSKFTLEYDKHFDSGRKISGIWVQEGFFERANYIGEKSYLLSNSNNDNYLTHMKGLNSQFQEQFYKYNIDHIKNPYISYNMFYKSPDFLIFKTYMNKNLFTNYVPIKRYFVCAAGSLPLKLY